MLGISDFIPGFTCFVARSIGPLSRLDAKDGLCLYLIGGIPPVVSRGSHSHLAENINYKPTSEVSTFMNGGTQTTELIQLAHLLRTCAETAKAIAWSIPTEAGKLLSVANDADRMAAVVEGIDR